MKRKITIFLTACLCIQMLSGCGAQQSISSSDAESSSAVSTTEDERASDLQLDVLQDNSALDEAANQLAETLIQDYGVSGVQYAVIENGNMLLSSVKGNIQSSDTVFGIASVSKMYIAASAMILVDQGKVDLDAPLTNYIPTFKMADDRYKRITPRMLLNHSSGLYGSHYLGGTTFVEASNRNKDMLLGQLETEQLKAEPGAFSVYCNDGYQLLEIMIEQVSGMAYHNFLDTYINKPLNLTKTTTPFAPSFDASSIAVMTLPGTEDALPVEMVNVTGTGGIYSTAEELCRFSEVLAGKHPEILSKESATAMQQQEYLNGLWISDMENDTGYGLGWDNVDGFPFSRYGIKALVKGGDSTTFHADLTVLPEHDVSIAVLTTGGSSLYATLMSRQVLTQYLQEKGMIEQPAVEAELLPPVKVEMPESLAAYSGLYSTGTFYTGRTATITVDNGTLTIAGGMGGMIPEETFVFTGNGALTSEDGTKTVALVEEANGETYLVAKQYLDFPGLGRYVLNGHQFQRVQPQTIDQAVADAWNLRKDTRYLCVNALPMECSYMEPFLMIYSPVIDTENGYVESCKIVDQNNAVNVVQIPIMDGRDTFDLRFFDEQNASYLQKGDIVYISEANISELPAGQSDSVIDENGYAQWFAIGSDSSEKSIRISLPESGSFSVYDNEQNCIYTSVMGVDSEIILPSNGFIVISGTPGSSFGCFVE